jgi:hypothetical protein
MKSILLLFITTLTLASCSTTTPVMKPILEVSANENPIVRVPASSNTDVTLTAEFIGRSEVNQHIYLIKQLNDYQWLLKDTAPCSSYPCAPEDYTINSQYNPKLISDSMADGDTVVELGKGVKLTFVNNGMTPPNPDGSRQKSYWELEYKKEKIKLDFFPRLKVGK